MSAGCGRCCRSKIAVISGYSLLALLPIGGRTQADGLSLFHPEIGVRILLVDVTQGVAEKSDVKMSLCSHIRCSSR